MTQEIPVPPISIALVYLGRRGSGGALSLELAQALAGPGSPVQLFAVVSRQAENVDRWIASGLDVLTVDTYETFGGALLSWANQFRLHSLAGQIRTRLGRPPDVLLFPMFHTWAPFLQVYLRPVPSVLTVHDPIPHPGWFSWLDARFQDLSIRQASRCIVLSHALVEATARRGIPASRVDVVPHGLLVPPAALPAPAQPGVQEPPTILFFGRIEPYKGLEVLLQAFRLLKQKGSPARLQIVGSGNFAPYAPLAEGLPDLEVVNRWIAEDEIAGFFQQASILVVPYTSATQSGPVSIAASFGLAVAATQTGGLPEQVQSGETGLLVPPRDPAALAAALQTLAANPALRERLGLALRQRHQELNNWPRIAQLTLAVCRRAAAGR